MTSGTFGRKLRRSMVRVGRCVIFGRMTGKTRIRRIVVIAVMADRTIIRYHCVRTVQLVIVIVNREGRRVPTRCCRMAHRAIGGNGQGCMIRIGSGGIFRRVTAGTGVWRVAVIAVVTSITIVGDRYVCTCKWINSAVVKC